jgi:hypothetical protein
MEQAPKRGSSVSTWLVCVALLVLALVLWGGYGHHWAWTGINGQTATLWDWLHLLMLPLLLPLVVVPALLPMAQARMTAVEMRKAAQDATEPAPAEVVASSSQPSDVRDA